MKRLILSASAVTLTLASLSAAAWWAPYYGAPYGPYAAPYGIAPPSPQQMREMAERKREAAMEMMETRRKAMESQRSVPPMLERPAQFRELSLPEYPSFGERPEMPEMPAFGERPTMPPMPNMPERTLPEAASSAMPAMPEWSDRPGFGEPPALPEPSLSYEERQAELEANRAALKQQAAERRAAMDAIAEQRRAVYQQRRQEWLCARQAMRPLPHRGPQAECASAKSLDAQDSKAPAAQSSDQTADSAPAPSKAS